MIDKFFGVHPAIIRSGTWKKMKPGEKDLLIYLMEQSEWCCTRELTRTDAQIHEAVGVAPRTLCNARKRLAEFGLVRYRRTGGNKYMYVICDPTTGKPYVGDTRQPLTCAKRGKAGGSSKSPPRARFAASRKAIEQPNPTEKQPCPLTDYGLPGIFR